MAELSGDVFRLFEHPVRIEPLSTSTSPTPSARSDG